MKAFKPYSLCPLELKPVGIPDEWPWQLVDCTIEESQRFVDDNFTLMTDAEYDNYLATNQSDFDLWNSSYKKVPETVSPRQIRIALVLSGINLSTIDTAIDSLPEPNKSIAKVSWEFSTLVERNNQMIESLAPYLGLTSSDIDDLFILAAQQ